MDPVSIKEVDEQSIHNFFFYAEYFAMQFAFILPICKMNVVEVVDTIFLTEGNTCHKENSISIDKHEETKLV